MFPHVTRVIANLIPAGHPQERGRTPRVINRPFCTLLLRFTRTSPAASPGTSHLNCVGNNGRGQTLNPKPQCRGIRRPAHYTEAGSCPLCPEYPAGTAAQAPYH